MWRNVEAMTHARRDLILHDVHVTGLTDIIYLQPGNLGRGNALGSGAGKGQRESRSFTEGNGIAIQRGGERGGGQ